ncbi:MULTISPECIES: PIN domain-containing protein [Oscillatoriales]|nr:MULTISPECIES: PIN domain-containing protein [Oscillatoriales]
MYLVDTNVLLRLVDRSHSLHPTIRTAIRKLRQNGDSLHITSQNCVEFWNVATRPIERNGFGLNPANADRLLRLIERLFSLLPISLTGLVLSINMLIMTYYCQGILIRSRIQDVSKQ